MPNNHRRLAVQLASQLPETQDEARKVLGHLQSLVENFLYGPQLTLVPAVGRNQPQGPSSLAEGVLDGGEDIPGQAPK